MPETPIQWQIVSTEQPPDWFVQALDSCMPQAGHFLAQILWQRGLQNPEELLGFLNPSQYKPASPFEFGEEMRLAIDRMQRAHTNQETVAIWGDFDADGVTATSLLWDGLGQFFSQQKTLFYYIPNRLTESHGLSKLGIDQLHSKGCQLIITCDTGSTNLAEIEYAASLGLDVIVTDHHTLPAERPPVTAIINPRYLPAAHPLATLSGVAVAYKLIEAMYETLPKIPQKPLEYLLDLVAIGLIADLVELKGDCRYLAQRGIEQLQKQSNPGTVTRPGVAKLLEFCNRSGDRPTDISFGLGPRINAVSRIQGDAHFCVELLTSQDRHLCTHLAEATELANARRKALQKEVIEQVKKRVAQLDLSTTSVIVLADEQWQAGVLGLVAGQIAQEYGRPTILLSTEPGQSVAAENGESEPTNSRLKSQVALARGSARSVNNIDLYQLVKNQEHLLTRFGGHPFAAGLSLPVENIPLFTDGINQSLRQFSDPEQAIPHLGVDLVVKVQDLGKELFQELKLLEPCGMGNPIPRLLIKDCWFENVWNKKIQDWKGRQVQYIKTEFALWDESVQTGFAGVWWGHYRDELPAGRCDAIVELDSNNYKKRYEVRLVAVRPVEQARANESRNSVAEWLLDWRGRQKAEGKGQEAEGKGQKAEQVHSNQSIVHQKQPAQGREEFLATPLPSSLSSLSSPSPSLSPLILQQCPSSWGEFQVWFRRSHQEQRPLAIAYPPPAKTSPQELWQQLVGIAKYLSRTGKTATRQQVLDKLEISDRTLQLGFRTLTLLGFDLRYSDNALQVKWHAQEGKEDELQVAVEAFFTAVKEEQFRRQYFYQVPLSTIQAVATQTQFD